MLCGYRAKLKFSSEQAIFLTSGFWGSKFVDFWGSARGFSYGFLRGRKRAKKGGKIGVFLDDFGAPNWLFLGVKKGAKKGSKMRSKKGLKWTQISISGHPKIQTRLQIRGGSRLAGKKAGGWISLSLVEREGAKAGKRGEVAG